MTLPEGAERPDAPRRVRPPERRVRPRRRLLPERRAREHAPPQLLEHADRADPGGGPPPRRAPSSRRWSGPTSSRRSRRLPDARGAEWGRGIATEVRCPSPRPGGDGSKTPMRRDRHPRPRPPPPRRGAPLLRAAPRSSSPRRRARRTAASSTTSFPRFEAATGITVKTIAVGSGEALAMGRRGDADVLLVHSKAAEDEFMAQGYGSLRLDVMHNDFVLVGPPSDPAGVKGLPAADALKKIAETGALFASRDDRSGTHARELDLWKKAGDRSRREALVRRHRTGDGRDGAGRLREAGLHARRPRHVPRAEEDARPRDPRRGKPGPLELLPRHRREPREAPEDAREGGEAIRRVARLPRRSRR